MPADFSHESGTHPIAKGSDCDQTHSVFPVDQHRQHLIRERAYSIYLTHSEAANDSLGDWLRAEREVNHEYGAVSCGPAKCADPAKRGHVTDEFGQDIENPA